MNEAQSRDAKKPLKEAKKVKPYKILKFLTLKVDLRYYLTLTTLITLTIFASIALNTSSTVLKEHKSRDIWSIFYLDMERLAQHLSEQLMPKLALKEWLDKRKSVCSIDGNEEVTSLYEILPNGKFVLINGEDLKISSLDEFSIFRQAELARWNLLVKGNQILSGIVLPITKTTENGQSIGVRRIAVGIFDSKIDIGLDKDKISKTAVYILSRQGKLIYSSSKEIDESNFLKRQLVQKFIELPVWQGLLDLVDDIPVYGFFKEIPHTNLVIFAETSQENIISQVREVTKNLLITISAYAIALIITLYFILSRLLRPISEIAKTSLGIANGNFDVATVVSGLGEVRQLTESFKIMIEGLKERDIKIRALTKEQIEKVRLEGEMAVAKRIQESLLTDSPMPSESGLILSALYHPAGEVAGDWYSYFYSRTRNEAIIVIVDVSGHGAGSSMFTTIAAAMFEEFRLSYEQNPNPEIFFKKLNNQLIKFGKDGWSATSQLLIYRHDQKMLDIFNAGHPPPIWRATITDNQFKPLRDLNSCPLGFEDSLALAHISVPFDRGQSCLIYTDGLSEMRSPQHKVLGTKKIIQALKVEHSPDELIADSLQTATRHANGSRQEDDVCMIALKCA